MDWPHASLLFADLVLPELYALSLMTSDDIPAVTEAIASWYPDIEVGMESVHSHPEFYENNALVGDDRPVLAILVRHNKEGIVGVLTLEKSDGAKSVSTRIGVLHPEHRTGALALLGPLLLERCARLMGAGLAHYFATLKSKHQQVIAERRGFRLVGIVPAHDIDMVRPKEARRVFEALYAKVLAPPDQVETPSTEQLTKNTRALWKHLFPELPLV